MESSDLAGAARCSLSGSWLSTRLGIGTSRIELMRRSGELLAFRAPGSQEYLYPAWQFDGRGRPLPIVSRLVAAARQSGLGPERLLELMEMRSGLIAGGGTLAEAVRAGRDDQVLAAIRDA
jgi:hypothetical protein